MMQCSKCKIMASETLLFKKLRDNTLWCEKCLLSMLKYKFKGVLQNVLS